MRVGGRDWLYAIGDVNGRALLTHMGKYQARVARRRHPRQGGRPRPRTGTGSPRVVFTDPQVAAVGYTLEQADGAGIDGAGGRRPDRRHRRRQLPSARNAAGTSQARGRRRRARVIVGATFVGPEVAELLHAATIAVVGEVPARAPGHAVAGFPTRSEIWLNLLEDYGL